MIRCPDVTHMNGKSNFGLGFQVISSPTPGCILVIKVAQTLAVQSTLASTILLLHSNSRSEELAHEVINPINFGNGSYFPHKMLASEAHNFCSNPSVHRAMGKQHIGCPHKPQISHIAPASVNPKISIKSKPKK